MEGLEYEDQEEGPDGRRRWQSETEPENGDEDGESRADGDDDG